MVKWDTECQSDIKRAQRNSRDTRLLCRQDPRTRELRLKLSIPDTSRAILQQHTFDKADFQLHFDTAFVWKLCRCLWGCDDCWADLGSEDGVVLAHISLIWRQQHEMPRLESPTSTPASKSVSSGGSLIEMYMHTNHYSIAHVLSDCLSMSLYLASVSVSTSVDTCIDAKTTSQTSCAKRSLYSLALHEGTTCISIVSITLFFPFLPLIMLLLNNANMWLKWLNEQSESYYTVKTWPSAVKLPFCHGLILAPVLAQSKWLAQPIALPLGRKPEQLCLQAWQPALPNLQL